MGRKKSERNAALEELGCTPGITYCTIHSEVMETLMSLPEKQRATLAGAFVTFFSTGEEPRIPKNLKPVWISLKISARTTRENILRQVNRGGGDTSGTPSGAPSSDTSGAPSSDTSGAAMGDTGYPDNVRITQHLALNTQHSALNTQHLASTSAPSTQPQGPGEPLHPSEDVSLGESPEPEPSPGTEPAVDDGVPPDDESHEPLTADESQELASLEASFASDPSSLTDASKARFHELYRRRRDSQAREEEGK